MPTEKFEVSEELRAATGKRRQASDGFCLRSDVHVVVRDKDGNIKSESFQHNLRTNGGADFWNTQLFGVSGINGQSATAGYMAITTDSAAAAATDTTLASEETTNGLQRTAQLTPSHSAGATSSQFTNTFTYTGSSSKVIAKLGLFNAASNGTLVLETVLGSTATVNANGDTISITWTINY